MTGEHAFDAITEVAEPDLAAIDAAVGGVRIRQTCAAAAVTSEWTRRNFSSTVGERTNG